jgi:hypothetical protein
MSRKKARRTAVRPFKPKNAVRRSGETRLGMLVIQQIPGPGSTPSDLAKQLDRDWFRSHPYRSHRIRPAVTGEIPGGGADTHVVVRQLAPGLRSRRAFDPVAPFPSGEAPEHVAHAIYDLVTEYQGRPVPGYELFNRIRAYAAGAIPEDPSNKNLMRRH